MGLPRRRHLDQPRQSSLGAPAEAQRPETEWDVSIASTALRVTPSGSLVGHSLAKLLP